MQNTKEVLILRQGATGYLLRKKMKYQKVRIENGIIKNKFSPRELAFVKANIPGKVLKY